MSNIEIACHNISKNFSGKTVFENINFSISSGESLSIAGINGSGKSTLIKIIANLIYPSKGEIKIRENNSDILKENWYLKTGLLSPYLNLYDELTGYENLEFFYNLNPLGSNNTQETIDSLLNEVNLYDKKNEYLRNYSSGMKQRLKLAFALISKPEILLMDEPRSNLDKSGMEIVNKIALKQKEYGILIIATNDEDDKQLCDESINMEDFK